MMWAVSAIIAIVTALAVAAVAAYETILAADDLHEYEGDEPY